MAFNDKHVAEIEKLRAMVESLNTKVHEERGKVEDLTNKKLH